MKTLKHILVMMAVCALVGADGHPLCAETVGQKEAKSMAQKFFNESKNYVTPPVDYVYNGKDLTTQRLFTPFYVFNSPSGGFVIVSAENKAFPILGYSLTEKFSKDKMSPMVRSILSDFSRDIEMIRYDSRVPDDAFSQWITYPEVVFDMLKNPDNEDYYAASYDDAERFWMVRKYATEFDFESPVMENFMLMPAAVEDVPLVTGPDIEASGGGHFTLTVPDEANLVIVYNLAGLVVDRKKIRNSNSVTVDLAGEPNGFYVAIVIDSNGIPHAAKLYR